MRKKLNANHNDAEEMLDMKKFDTPRMERINLARQSVMVTSLCNAQYCCGHQCPSCDDEDTTCNVVTCQIHDCGRVLCVDYQGELACS